MVLCAFGWVLLLWMAPVWIDGSSDGTVRRLLGTTIHVAGAGICHQNPERSFRRHGHPLPVCARCTGLYTGGALGLLILGALRPGRSPAGRTCRTALAIAALPTLVTLAVEHLGISDPGNVRRAVSAMPLGATAGWILGAAVEALFTPRAGSTPGVNRRDPLEAVESSSGPRPHIR